MIVLKTTHTDWDEGEQKCGASSNDMSLVQYGACRCLDQSGPQVGNDAVSLMLSKIGTLVVGGVKLLLRTVEDQRR